MSRNDTVTDLREIEKRLMEATGPNLALEVLIWETIDPKAAGLSRPPNYTASLDAAVALCERVLPDFSRACAVYFMDGKRTHVWTIRGQDTDGNGFTGIRENDALALCLAIVRALIAKEQTP